MKKKIVLSFALGLLLALPSTVNAVGLPEKTNAGWIAQPFALANIPARIFTTPGPGIFVDTNNIRLGWDKEQAQAVVHVPFIYVDEEGHSFSPQELFPSGFVFHFLEQELGLTSLIQRLDEDQLRELGLDEIDSQDLAQLNQPMTEEERLNFLSLDETIGLEKLVSGSFCVETQVISPPRTEEPFRNSVTGTWQEHGTSYLVKVSPKQESNVLLINDNATCAEVAISNPAWRFPLSVNPETLRTSIVMSGKQFATGLGDFLGTTIMPNR